MAMSIRGLRLGTEMDLGSACVVVFIKGERNQN